MADVDRHLRRDLRFVSDHRVGDHGRRCRAQHHGCLWRAAEPGAMGVDSLHRRQCGKPVAQRLGDADAGSALRLLFGHLHLLHRRFRGDGGPWNRITDRRPSGSGARRRRAARRVAGQHRRGVSAAPTAFRGQPVRHRPDAGDRHRALHRRRSHRHVYLARRVRSTVGASRPRLRHQPGHHAGPADRPETHRFRLDGLPARRHLSDMHHGDRRQRPAPGLGIVDDYRLRRRQHHRRDAFIGAPVKRGGSAD